MGGRYGNGQRFPREEAGRILGGVVKELLPYSNRVTVCGSYRRGKPDCGDGDIVVLIRETGRWVEAMEALGEEPMTKSGSVRKGIITVRDGFQVDINRAKDECEMGAMMLFATGSGEFNQATRTIAKRKGWKLNRYGLWDRDTDELVACDEEEILEALGLGWIPPVDRTGWEVVHSKKSKAKRYLGAEEERAARRAAMSREELAETAARNMEELFG